MAGWHMRARSFLPHGGMRAFLIGLSVLAALALPGCATTPPNAEVGEKAYLLIPPPGAATDSRLEYKIGPLDVLSIRVFQEKDLSLEEVPVDASGNIIFPLIGQIQVAGRTSADVSSAIAAKLGERFLVNPQVSVLIKSSVSQKVTVDGEVKEPGVYALQGDTTLIQAIAMAKGTSNIAKLDEVIVFRQIDRTRFAARFNIEDIRKGRAADPRILGDDTVVVGLSRGKSFFRDLLTVAPALTSGFVAIQQATR